jgi:shikimate dehydrogenase
MRCAVLGSPIGHSLSPTIHNRAYELLGIDGEYERFDVDSAQLGQFLREHSPSQWRGFSLTMPLKETGVIHAAVTSPEVKLSGVLNTLLSKGNEWHGFNTDVVAMRSLLASENFGEVVILGAGGTARAALAALSGRECEVTICRRSSRRDQALQAIRSGLRFVDWQRAEDLLGADLVINTAPASALVDLTNEAPSPKALLDAIYLPWPPPLALRSGVGRYISGKELLVEQGIEQIRLFTERDFKADFLRAELLESIA